MPLSRAATWGVVAGLLVGGVPFLIGEPTAAIPLWILAGTTIGSAAILSAVSAVASVMVFRNFPGRQTPATPAPQG